MKQNSKNINRRSFVGKTGAIAAGLTLLPGSFEVSMRKKGNSLFVYLINFTSEMKRPIQKIIPCANIRIDILINEKVKRLKALCLEKNLKFTSKGNSISFVLPVIKDYEVMEIKLG